MTKLLPAAFISLALLAIGWMVPAVAGEPVLVYQRIHSLVAHHDNRISLRVWADDRMEIRFPAYTPRAGRHEQRLTPEQRSELLAIVDGLPDITQQELSARIEHRRDGERFHVADADIVRFEYRPEETRETVLAVPAPDVWSRLSRGDAELAAIAATEQALRRWMDSRLVGEEGNR